MCGLHCLDSAQSALHHPFTAHAACRWPSTSRRPPRWVPRGPACASGSSTSSSSACCTSQCEPSAAGALPPVPPVTAATLHVLPLAGRPATWCELAASANAPACLALQAPVCRGGGAHLLGAPHSACGGAVGGGAVCLLQVGSGIGRGPEARSGNRARTRGESGPCGTLLTSASEQSLSSIPPYPALPPCACSATAFGQPEHTGRRDWPAMQAWLGEQLERFVPSWLGELVATVVAACRLPVAEPRLPHPSAAPHPAPCSIRQRAVHSAGPPRLRQLTHSCAAPCRLAVG